MLLKAKIGVIRLKEIVNLLMTARDRVKLKLSNNGIHVESVDLAHVYTYAVWLKDRVFIDGITLVGENHEEDVEIGLNLAELKSLLRNHESGTATIVLDDERPSELTVRESSIDYKSELTPVDISAITDPKVPKIDLISFKLERLDVLHKFVKTSKQFSDMISIRTNVDSSITVGHKAIASLPTHLRDSVKRAVPLNRTVDIPIMGDGSYVGGKVSIFSNNYFEEIIESIMEITKTVKISMGKDMPIQFEFNEGGIVGLFLLAPRIESE